MNAEEAIEVRGRAKRANGSVAKVRHHLSRATEKRVFMETHRISRNERVQVIKVCSM